MNSKFRRYYNFGVAWTLEYPPLPKGKSEKTGHVEFGGMITEMRKADEMWKQNGVAFQRAAALWKREAVLDRNDRNKQLRSKRQQWVEGAGNQPSRRNDTGDPVRAAKRETYRRHCIAMDIPCASRGDHKMFLYGLGFSVTTKIRVPEHWDIRSYRIVETTRRITRHTLSEHRTCQLHVTIRVPDPEAVEALRIAGSDWGVDHELTVANEDGTGGMHFDMPEDVNRCTGDDVDRARAETDRSYRTGSRRWNRETRRIRRSARGRKNAHGKTAAAKRGLDRSIAYACAGSMRKKSKRRAEKKGKRAVSVKPAFTRQTCGRCGHIARNNRDPQADFRCLSCDWTSNADVNAETVIALVARRSLTTLGVKPPAAGHAVA